MPRLLLPPAGDAPSPAQRPRSHRPGSDRPATSGGLGLVAGAGSGDGGVEGLRHAADGVDVHAHQRGPVQQVRGGPRRQEPGLHLLREVCPHVPTHPPKPTPSHAPPRPAATRSPSPARRQQPQRLSASLGTQRLSASPSIPSTLPQRLPPQQSAYRRVAAAGWRASPPASLPAGSSARAAPESQRGRRGAHRHIGAQAAPATHSQRGSGTHKRRQQGAPPSQRGPARHRRI
jgi:hypothetical protein